ncbi:MAG: hypothetical protein ACRDG5_02550 [Anaerolineales bacterium]
MNVRLDVTYELALESQARIREQARTQWAARPHGNTSHGKADGLEPAGQGLARGDLRASWAQDGHAS